MTSLKYLLCTQDWIKGTALPVTVEERLEELEAIERGR